MHGYPYSTGLQFHLTFTLVRFPVASTDVGGGVGLGAVAVTQTLRLAPGKIANPFGNSLGSNHHPTLPSVWKGK